jgi:dihydroorotate dehydrogenase
MYSFIRPLLFALSPETAHHFTLSSLQKVHQFKLTKLLFGKSLAAPCTVMGLNFPNPLGLAAGLDKNAEYVDCLASLGFGFIEVGTVTPRPQRGNPSPRLFRLPEVFGLINRMGFNNYGVDNLINNLQKAKFRGILGINIGKNADTSVELTISDYLIGFFKVYPLADYVAVNISSPNTENLREWQQGELLDNLLNALKQAQEQLANQHDKYVPLVIKIAPDLSVAEVTMIANKLLFHKIDGVIATNTTVAREEVRTLRYGNETGGLSGEPLFKASTLVVQQLNAVLQGRIPIIASGGVMNVASAQQKLQAGASLVQIYTGLIYHGPALVREIIQGLPASKNEGNV